MSALGPFADNAGMRSFRWVFVAVFAGTALVVAAILINARRPPPERMQPTAAFVTASGKCAECHRLETPAIVREYEMSVHARASINCLDCHAPAAGQDKMDHEGFVIAKGGPTAKSCARCHAAEYGQFARSRHAAPAWTAVRGTQGFTEAQRAAAERDNPGWIDRPPNPLTELEGGAAIASGCEACHSIGRPNADGSIGRCTPCHARHAASVGLARLPATCGQCHMGPDHSQIEIYDESKHGVLFVAQRDVMNLEVKPKELTPADMPVPTCATCHLSGMGGMKVTHNPGERLSYYLFQDVSQKRPEASRNAVEMKQLCENCHTAPYVDRFYEAADAVVAATNEKVKAAEDVVAGLRKEKLLDPKPFSQPIDFIAFDLWHYYGRTAKHGAFMGGADFVQWHGSYELLRMRAELEQAADELRAGRARR